MNQMDPRQTIPYARKDLIYPNYNQTLTNPTHTYYPITDQLQYVESRIVTENNSSLVSAINLNPNKLSAYQRSVHHDMNVQENQLGIVQQHYSATHQLGNNKGSRPGSNKISVVADSQSIASSLQRNDSSVNKRPGSVTRGGIKVVSRNSSMDKKSQTSVQKSITSKDLNTVPHQKPTNTLSCGLNCTTRNPFTQTEHINQITVPNLGSLQTLKSNITQSHLPDSEREHFGTHRNPSQQKLNKNFYENISQRTHIEPVNHYGGQRNHSELMKENVAVNGNSLEKVYKQVREMMEKEIVVARKVYEKKYLDEIECLNSYYKTQIDTLQKVLAQNLTVVQQQSIKISRLQQKVLKKQAKRQKYTQRMDSMMGFIQKSSRFALQRIDEVEHKFILLLSAFQELHVSPSDALALENKVCYLEGVFSSVVARTIVKYRSIEWGIKEEVKEMMKKYEYYEEKIYEMDLMKHLGKENQIQNYRLVQNIQSIKEKLVILESKANMRSEVRQLSSGITTGDSGNELKNTYKVEEPKNTYKVEELKRAISNLQYKLNNLENQNAETHLNTYKLENLKNQLQNKLSIAQNQLITTKKQFIKLRLQRDQLSADKNQLLTERQDLKLLTERQYLQKEKPCQSPQKTYSPNYIQESSQKKSHHQLHSEDNQLTLLQMKREVERLQEIIDQYEAKIQQLHDAIYNLQKQNAALITTLDHNSSLQKTKPLKQLPSNKPERPAVDPILIQKLNQQLNQRDTKIQYLEFSLEQVSNDKQQLESALQMTEKIFDQQISKFKETISKLQDENDLLLAQICQLRSGQHLSESASSTKSNMQKVTLAKSPKKEMCETVTMGWFKKNVSNLQTQANSHEHRAKTYQNHTHYTQTQSSPQNTSPQNTSPQNTKPSPSNIKSNLSSPINQYYTDHSQKSKLAQHYRDEIKQYSSNLYTQQQQKDEFFYPQPANNLSSRRSIDSTSIMQSQPNINPYDPVQSCNSKNPYYEQKATKAKLQTQKIQHKIQAVSPILNKFDQYGNHQQQYQKQQEETQTYIF